MLMHMCPHPGCREVIPITQPYCGRHVSRHKQYDQTVRIEAGAQFNAFYQSTEWEQTKTIINNRYHGLCLWSYYHGDIAPSKAIHHIVPLREDWSRRAGISNLIPLTQDAHAMVEAEYRKGNKARMQRELFELIGRWNQEFGTR